LDKDSIVELKDNNQTLVIKREKQEMKGMYQCVVNNKLNKMEIGRSVKITGKNN
jgi:hypothetical protein